MAAPVATTVLKVDHTLDAPTEYVRGALYPFNNVAARETLADFADTLEVFIPRVIFKDNAKSLNQLNIDAHPGIARYYTQILQLFGFVANRVPKKFAGEDFAPVVVLYSVVPLKQDEDDDVMPSLEGQTPGGYTKCDERKIAGIRIRVAIQTAFCCAGALVDELIYDNEVAPKKQLRAGIVEKKGVREFEYKGITREIYLQMCVSYTGDRNLLSNKAGLALNLWDRDNPINPVNVFTVERSLALSKRVGAMPEVCDLWSYQHPMRMEDMQLKCPDMAAFADNQGPNEPADGLDADVAAAIEEQTEDVDPENPRKKAKKKRKQGSRRPERVIETSRSAIQCLFPRGGADVYSVAPDYINPLRHSTYYLPHMTKPVAHNSAEKDLYMMLYGSGSIYRSCVNTTAAMPEANDLAHLMKRMVERYASILPAARASHYNYTTQHEFYMMEGFKEWETIYNVDGDIGDSVKAITKWDKEYLSTHNNFCMPLPINLRNLSRIGNLFANLNVMLDTVFGVSHLNNEILSGWVGDMHVFYPVPFHSNSILGGENSTGKSFVLDIQMKFLITGTFMELAYESDKAKATDTKVADMRVEFFPEIPPPMIGVNDGPVGQQAGNTMQQALLKMRLTTGRMPFSVKQPLEGGGSTTVEKIGYCNTKFNGACNVECSKMPAPTKSRFYCQAIFEGTKRGDGQGPTAKLGRKTNPAVAELEATLLLRMKRTQSLFSKIATLIGGGVLPDIHMRAVISILLNVMKVAQGRGLSSTTAVRHLERVIFHVQCIAIIRVIDLIFDSEISPLKGKKWKPEHILLVRPYLFATVEDLSIAFSLLEKQFEDPVAFAVIEELKKQFPGARPAPEPARAAAAVAASAAGAYDPFGSPSALELNPQHYCIETYTPPSWSQKTDSESVMRAHLANSLMERMQPKPQLAAVKNVLYHLCNAQVDSGDGKKTMIPVLRFQYGRRGFAWSSLERDNSVDKLAGAFAEVMSYPGATQQTFVYAKPNPKHPYIIKTIRNNPSNDNPPVLMHDPDYFDDTMVQMTKNLTLGVFGEDLSDKPEERVDFAKAFSTMSDVVMNSDADEFTAHEFARTHLISQECIQKIGVPISVRQQFLDCLSTYGGDTGHMKTYPKCFLPILVGASNEERVARRSSSSAVVAAAKQVMEDDHRKSKELISRKRKREMRAIDQAAAAAAALAEHADEEEEKEGYVSQSAPSVLQRSSSTPPPVNYEMGENGTEDNFCDDDLMGAIAEYEVATGVRGMEIDDDEAERAFREGLAAASAGVDED